jgi:hypothetical protein
MLYSYFVKKLVRQSFENVNHHEYEELLKAVAPNVHHRFAGAHSIGGERHDKEAMSRWLERVGRVLPNLHIKVNDIWVKGWPFKPHPALKRPLPSKLSVNLGLRPAAIVLLSGVTRSD